MSAAIISIKPIYVNLILAGSKTIELRKSPMGLNTRDVVLVYSSAPEQRIVFWFRIEKIETFSVAEMWERYQNCLGISYENYNSYFASANNATGFHIGEIHKLKPMHLDELQRLVPGFVPPQGMIWIREAIGRYERLLQNLSIPLPTEVFPQTNLVFNDEL